jgi:hypothetical protein
MRAKFYGEIRLSQYLLGVVDPIGNSYESNSGTTGTYHPTLVAFQVGIGW